MKIFQKIIFTIFLCSFVACLGGSIDKRGAVSGYKDGKVDTVGGGYYRIGEPSSHWRLKETKHRAVLFENKNDSSTMMVSSWCKGAFDDAPLSILADQQLMGLENLKKLRSQKTTLNEREALKTEAKGKADGAWVYVRSYVLKMNNCVFDFVYVSSPEVMPSVDDFETLVNGFVFGKGPRVL